jgi:hypothetical protein
LLSVGSILATAGVVLVLVFSAFPVLPAAPSGVNQADSEVIVHLPAYGTYVKFAQGVWFDYAYYFADHANFSDFAFSSQRSTAQTLGVAIRGGNATIASLDSNDVFFALSCHYQTTCYLYFYYPLSPPYSVTAGSIQICQNSCTINYYTDVNTFTSAGAPAAYWNSASKYVEIKLVNPGKVMWQLTNQSSGVTLSSTNMPVTTSNSSIITSTIVPTTTSTTKIVNTTPPDAGTTSIATVASTNLAPSSAKEKGNSSLAYSWSAVIVITTLAAVFAIAYVRKKVRGFKTPEPIVTPKQQW